MIRETIFAPPEPEQRSGIRKRWYLGRSALWHEGDCGRGGNGTRPVAIERVAATVLANRDEERCAIEEGRQRIASISAASSSEAAEEAFAGEDQDDQEDGTHHP